MPDIYTHDISGCFAAVIGDRGASAESMAMVLDAAEGPWTLLRGALAEDDFPPLTLVQQTDDLDEIRSAAKCLSEHCDVVAIIGVGGSSLGGEALAALAARPPVELRFLDNPDPDSLARFVASVDLARTGAVVVSKSGGTAETLAMAMTIVPLLAAARESDAKADFVVAIAEPGDNPLRRLVAHWDITVIDHDPEIGGRYAVFSAAGLLPAALVGLDIEAIRAGGAEALEINLRSEDGRDAPAVTGAAVSIELLRAQGARTTVLMPYADTMAPLARWYRQLWAESLGKNGRGTTPIDALGAVDQHSQLQLYLDGPDDKMFTVITQELAGRGERVAPALAEIAGVPYLAGYTTGDLMSVEQAATIESLLGHNRPVRRMGITRVDETAIGALMVHFMLETVMAAFLLGVDAFDQPAVEDGKENARRRLLTGRTGISS
ncbi:MAG: glucose-6-phosphate isomerase [Alphaproteobacteria bacterium]|nr:glucose-6-phosphate isomerase [Alphaproteobacteria bacterium]